jgi:hypothetical protein
MGQPQVVVEEVEQQQLLLGWEQELEKEEQRELVQVVRVFDILS